MKIQPPRSAASPDRGRLRHLHADRRAVRASRAASDKRGFDQSALVRDAVDHPIRTSLPALAGAVLGVLAIVGIISPHAVGRAFAHHHLGWLLIAALAELVSVGGYALAYRTIARRIAGLEIPAPVVVRMVLTGFGMFAVFGGFSLDRLHLTLMGVDRKTAGRSVLSLGVLEGAVLGISACLASIALLATGSGVEGSMLWPWAVGIPVGAAAVEWHKRRSRLLPGALLQALERRLVGIESAFSQLLQSPLAWLGMAVYFGADIASLGAALRAVNLSVAALPLLIAFASGFTMTRRTLPAAGAGVVELLLTLSLYWVGVPIAGALAGVVVYRGFNLILIAGLATAARHELPAPTELDSADSEDAPAGQAPPVVIDERRTWPQRRRRRLPAAP